MRFPTPPRVHARDELVHYNGRLPTWVCARARAFLYIPSCGAGASGCGCGRFAHAHVDKTPVLIPVT